MRAYIANVLPRLKEYSARLDNLALFTDQPWIQIDESGNRTVFVFRSEGNELLISKNGNVNTCSWEYLEYMNSLLVEANGKKTLYNQGFMDETVMILSKDGQSDYLLLANENKVEERNAEKILSNLSQKYLTADSVSAREDESVDQTPSRKRKGISKTEKETRVKNKISYNEGEFPRVSFVIIVAIVVSFFISLFVIITFGTMF